MIRTRSRSRYSVPGNPIASAGIEYGWPACITTPVGVTLTGIRSAKSAAAIFNGRKRAILRDARGWRDTGRPRRPTRIRVGQPLAQLPLQIKVIEKPPLFEERSVHPADEILDAAFLLRPIRPAHFDADPEIERHAGKR